MAQKILFPENFNQIIFDLLKENNLTKTKKEYFEDFKNGIIPTPTIIINLIKDFVENKITKESFILKLQEDLKITKITSEKIFTSINAKIISFVAKIDIIEETKENYEKKDRPVQNSESTEDILLKPLDIKTNIAKPKEEIIKPEKVLKKTKKIAESVKKITEDNKKSDTYREPIE